MNEENIIDAKKVDFNYGKFLQKYSYFFQLNSRYFVNVDECRNFLFWTIKRISLTFVRSSGEKIVAGN